jgi:two-component system, OmpR family, sensor histidine kinase BaeS
VNRLVTRMALAMMGVVVLTVVLIVGSQIFVFSRSFDNLPPELRRQMMNIRNNLDNDIPLTPSETDFIRGFEAIRVATRNTTLITLLISALLASFVAWRLSRTIAKPIESVSQAATEVAKGNLHVRANLSPKQLEAKNETSELARNFNAMAQSLQDYEHERRAMIADIAHELRTPLTVLDLRLEAMLADLVPLDKSELQKLKKQIDLLIRLVHDLRTLSLADEGKLSLQCQSVALDDLVKEQTSNYELPAKSKEISLMVETQPITAYLDPERLEQMLGNLLDNALRVTPIGGAVRVCLTENQDMIELSVSDSGPGIPAADLPHIFDRFIQGKDTKGSSGLGLAIVQTLAKLHGGSVQASNQSTGGAMFRLSLPKSVKQIVEPVSSNLA